MNAFIQIDTIPGESQDDQHSNWIEPKGFSFSATQPTGGPTSDSGTRAQGRVELSDFQFVKAVDVASTKLMLECAKATNIKKVTVQVHRATGKRELYYEVIMENVLITNVSISASEEGLPMESVSMNAGQIKFKYIQFDTKGQKVKETKSGWDMEKDKELAG
ncbi:MAG: type VI secretion system tube protein Hcp [Verrucomicrobiales bacterium]|nr:type VI secretion system tube protein Hcp [Verrucomicrobiales bacterium]